MVRNMLSLRVLIESFGRQYLDMISHDVPIFCHFYLWNLYSSIEVHFI
jgi:hypothetical protein